MQVDIHVPRRWRVRGNMLFFSDIFYIKGEKGMSNSFSLLFNTKKNSSYLWNWPKKERKLLILFNVCVVIKERTNFNSISNSYTFERVQENSEKLWRFERYTVINDYDWRIPSPINLVFLPYRFFCCPTRENCCLHKCQSKKTSRFISNG